MTEQGVIVGIFQYMSPEQIEGKDLDGRSDIFRLALCCTRCLQAGVHSKAKANSALPRPSWKGNHIILALGLLAMLMFWGRGKCTQPQTEGLVPTSPVSVLSAVISAKTGVHNLRSKTRGI
jgi:hypothetical protein